jgi:DNA (cytosine-5)-methyltransferase 1
MGLDLGLEAAGVHVRCALEFDRECCNTIRANRPSIPLVEGDIRDVSGADILAVAGLERVDLVCGGPPCQAFSTAGRRLGLDDDRGNVFLKFLDLIGEIGPTYVLIENVRGLLSAPAPGDDSKGGAVRLIARRLRKSGYVVTFTLYDAANYGVPQRRERVIMLASRGGPIPLVPPTHGDGRLPWVTFREAVAGVKSLRYGSFSAKMIRFLQMLGPGQNWRDLPLDLQEEAMGGAYQTGGGKVGFYRRLAWDKPCPTLLTSPTQKATCLCHPDEDRPLSVEEYGAVQQFPPHWQFSGSIASVYKQIGNAVPVGLGRAVGRHLLWWDSASAAARFGMQVAPPDVRYSRYRGTSHLDFLGV